MIRRRKIPCAVLTFSTTAAAIHMETACREKQIPGRLIPTPVSITAECGLAWKMPEEEYRARREEVEALGISFAGPVFLEL